LPDGGKTGKQLFEQALSGTLRAIAEDKELSVTFSADASGLSEDGARLPHLAHKPSLKDIAEMRGLADSIALKARHHDADIFAKNCPSGPLSRQIFSHLEDVRYEAIGAKQMPGAAANLNALNEKRVIEQGLNRHDSDIPFEEMLAATVGQMVRQAVCGEKPSEKLGPIYDETAAKIEAKVAPLIAALTDTLTDQEKASDVIRNFINDLVGDGGENEDREDSPDDSDDAAGDETEESQDAEGDSGSDEEDGGEDDGMDDGTDGQADESEDGDLEVDNDDMSDTDPSMDGMVPRRPNFPDELMSKTSFYRAYTDSFDEVIRAEDLCDMEELDRLRKYLDQQMEHLSAAVSKLANRLQRRLMAQQRRKWNFDLEEGMLDGGRLARVVANPTNPLSYKQESDTKFRDTVVTLLIDNSGSMRGRPISIAAICADILARTLERCGVKVEILGFTTKAWKGGSSREKWINADRPVNPGRLNDIRHIIYKTADMPLRRARRNLGLMMREGLLKENIDGEALMWAHQRLLARSEDRRIMMVISDGAPVDDSTQSTNSSTYLEQHLRQVIHWIEARSPVELIAIGIGHDVTRYYDRAVTILDAEQLAGAMTDQLAELFEDTLPTPRGRK